MTSPPFSAENFEETRTHGNVILALLNFLYARPNVNADSQSDARLRTGADGKAKRKRKILSVAPNRIG
jgi:hypothetical protein